MQFDLDIHLLSDTTFARGDGTGAVVDVEVEYDLTTGLPYIRGRVLKGLLTEECANLMFAQGTTTPRMALAARHLFGVAGSSMDSDGHLHVGPANLPVAFVNAIRASVNGSGDFAAGIGFTSEDVLEQFTAIRRQTSVTEAGVPDDGSLRSMRVVKRNQTFTATLELSPALDANRDRDSIALLFACAQCVRRGGLGRNRGRGKLALALKRAPQPVPTLFARFKEMLSE